MTTAESTLAGRLGIEPGQTVGEFGWDEDSDEELRRSVAERTGTALLDEDAEGTLDAVLLWWREGDGDLADALTNAVTSLAGDGFVWLLSPGLGHDGHVEAAEIQEEARTAGLSRVGSLRAAGSWMGTRLVRATR